MLLREPAVDNTLTHKRADSEIELPREAAHERLLLVNLDFPPVTGPGIWRMLAFTKYAAEDGHEVRVLCSDRASWHSRTDDSLLVQIPAAVKVYRLRSRFMHEVLEAMARRAARSRTGLMRRIWAAMRWRVRDYYPDFAVHWGFKAAMFALRNAKRWQLTCVVTSGPQHISHLTGLVLKKFAGVRWIMDYRDPWTGNPTQGQFPQGPYQKRLHDWLERRCVRHADLVTVVTPTWRQALARRYVACKPDARFVYLPNGHDMASLPTASPWRLPQSEGHLWLHFNGTLQTGNDASACIFAAMAKIRETRGHDALPFVSFCGMPDKSRLTAEQLGVSDRVIDLGVMPYKQALATCLGADALLVLVRTGDELQRGVVPGKIYEAMALAKPIFAIVPTESDVRALLVDHPDATLCIDDEVSVTTAMELMLTRKNDHTLHRFSNGDRARLLSQFMRKRQTEELLRLIAGLRH